MQVQPVRQSKQGTGTFRQVRLNAEHTCRLLLFAIHQSGTSPRHWNALLFAPFPSPQRSRQSLSLPACVASSQASPASVIARQDHVTSVIEPGNCASTVLSRSAALCNPRHRSGLLYSQLEQPPASRSCQVPHLHRAIRRLHRVAALHNLAKPLNPTVSGATTTGLHAMTAGDNKLIARPQHNLTPSGHLLVPQQTSHGCVEHAGP